MDVTISHDPFAPDVAVLDDPDERLAELLGWAHSDDPLAVALHEAGKPKPAPKPAKPPKPKGGGKPKDDPDARLAALLPWASSDHPLAVALRAGGTIVDSATATKETGGEKEEHA